MSTTLTAAVVIVLAAAGFWLGRGRAFAANYATARPARALPSYYGWYVALWCGIPAFVLVVAWALLQPTLIEHLVISGLPDNLRNLPPERLGLLLNDLRNIASGSFAAGTADPAIQEAAARLASLNRIAGTALFALALAVAVAGLAFARGRVRPELRARNTVEKVLEIALIASSTIAVFVTAGIVLSLLFETLRFFGHVGVFEFLFGLEWSPQTALRADQVGSSGAFGIVPLVAGTLLITVIAMFIAVPVGLMSAVYMAEYAPPAARDVLKPALEILAGIPTVVYGFFAALTVAPFIRDAGAALGFGVASESALAAGLVMGIMIIPFVSSLSDDVINAVPQALRDGSYALGATRSETIRQVVLPAALPGIVGGVLLAVSRAIGETMIVVMAAGLAANLTLNPFAAVTTVTVQIVTLLVGDQEFDSAKTLAAFALGLTLFCITLALNVFALSIVRKYREKYD